MSHQYRQPSGTRPLVPGSMMPPVGATGAPHVFPSNAVPLIGLATHGSNRVIYPYADAELRFAGAAAPMNYPQMFIPVVQHPSGPRMPTGDPAKLYEERRKLEKERNFQLQQQRLKQFTVAGKKGSMNADNLIDSMFGKIQPRRNSFGSSVKATDVSQETVTTSSSAAQYVFSHTPPSTTHHQEFNGTSQIHVPVERNVSSGNQPEKDPRRLDTMMLECSNLTGPLKAKTFHKPSVKELPPSSPSGATFASSERARDWKNVQELNNVFSTPNKLTGFPSWCCKQGVPDLYHKVEAFVTDNYIHGIDINLLLPVFMSSGLSRETLGQIWELVNHTDPNGLTPEEMYAALALIAVAQAGHPMKAAILHALPNPPVPQLPGFLKAYDHITAQQQKHEEADSPAAEEMPKKSRSTENIPYSLESETSGHQVIRPTAITLTKIKHPEQPTGEPACNATSLEKNISSWDPFKSSGFISSPDDDFDDFKSATPTAVNVAIDTPTDITKEEDEFDDFKQAPVVTSSEKHTTEQSDHFSNPLDQDLMSPEEDKYSVFRSLQHQEETTDWSGFASDTLDSPVPCTNDDSSKVDTSSNSSLGYSSLPQDANSGSTNFFSMSNEKDVQSQPDDDFGDFFHADVTSSTSIPAISIEKDNFTPNFADFSKINDSSFNTSDFPDAFCNVDSSACAESGDSEFGDFASSAPVVFKPEIGHEFLFRHIKDNISLAESQSVSSLELGTFDGSGTNGDCKSSLSRQGSIPSLDLKVVGLESADNDDVFGEMQAAGTGASKSPSPSKEFKGSDNKSISNAFPGLPFQPTSTLPLTDKYSVIRSEQIKEEDQHISDWIRCLQSSLNILQNAKRIFNQMSCSSVCNEVINSEEGENYVKNVTEVYKVVCRISLASKSVGKQTEKLLKLLKEADQTWNTVCGFFAGSTLMPGDSGLDFSSGILRSDPENNLKACGLCLLNVDSRSKAFDQVEDIQKLSYGGRNYHSTCANLWVNCVDPLLPALTLPQLL